jgi:hypothetical protein
MKVPDPATVLADGCTKLRTFSMEGTELNRRQRLPPIFAS